MPAAPGESACVEGWMAVLLQPRRVSANGCQELGFLVVAAVMAVLTILNGEDFFFFRW